MSSKKVKSERKERHLKLVLPMKNLKSCKGCTGLPLILGASWSQQVTWDSIQCKEKTPTERRQQTLYSKDNKIIWVRLISLIFVIVKVNLCFWISASCLWLFSIFKGHFSSINILLKSRLSRDAITKAKCNKTA